MLKVLQAPFRHAFGHVDMLFDKPFGPPWNPMRQLGSLAFFFYWVAAVTGIYVYIVFDTSVQGAYGSVEWMTHDQWYLAGVMRSLHRYSSDAMVITAMLHLLREFAMDRHRGVRWFAWFTGVPVIWLLYVSGISGYWLVWDQLAQYLAVGSMEWIDWIGIFGEPVANNFLTRGSLDDRFFTLLIFIHIFGPLFLLILMWIHVIRVSQAKTNPARGLALGSFIMLVVLSFAYPAISHPEADLGIVPGTLNLDWYFMFLYPIYDIFGSGVMWALSVGGSLFICVMPWLPPERKPVVPKVYLEQCNGCTRCFEDCPYGAVVMQPRTDGRAFEREAIVNPDVCTGCGICVGACPTSTPFRVGDAKLVTGIDLPSMDLDSVRTETVAALEAARADGDDANPSLVIFGCNHGPDLKPYEGRGIRSVTLSCIGMLPPSFMDFLLTRKQGIDGVMLTGCSECDCHHRLGIRWTEDRIAGLRDPYLRKRVPRERLHSYWAGKFDAKGLNQEIGAFRDRLLQQKQEAAQSGDPS